MKASELLKALEDGETIVWPGGGADRVYMVDDSFYWAGETLLTGTEVVRLLRRARECSIYRLPVVVERWLEPIQGGEWDSTSYEAPTSKIKLTYKDDKLVKAEVL